MGWALSPTACPPDALVLPLLLLDFCAGVHISRFMLFSLRPTKMAFEANHRIIIELRASYKVRGRGGWCSCCRCRGD